MHSIVLHFCTCFRFQLCRFQCNSFNFPFNLRWQSRRAYCTECFIHVAAPLSPSVPSLPLFFGVGQSCDLPRHPFPFPCRSCMWRPCSARRRCANCPRSSSSTAAETATTNCTPRPLAGIRLQAGNLPPPPPPSCHPPRSGQRFGCWLLALVPRGRRSWRFNCKTQPELISLLMQTKIE